MTIFQILNVMGGLAFFLFGMHVMSNGLKEAAGGKMEEMLQKMTDHPAKSFVFGAFITIAIQSSSALTVMLVGLVNSGIMDLSQTVGIIMGSNVGTTLTTWILGISGMETDNLFWAMLKPESLSLFIALVGVVMLMAAKERRTKNIGSIFIGFSVLMHGMQMMSDTLKPLAELPEFARILTAFQNPFLGVVVGTIFTGVIQSSAASVGVLQALSLTGRISYGMAIPIIMGQNIGTCVTALISGIGANKNAKRAALIHLYFNLIGTILFMSLFYLLDTFVGFPFMNDNATKLGIAVIHTIFNVFATLFLLPFAKGLEKLACLTVRDESGNPAEEQKKQEFMLLDNRFLDKPAFAVERCKQVSFQMAALSEKAIMQAVALLDNYNDDVRREIIEIENKVDRYEDELGTYMVKLAGKNMSENDSRAISMLLHCIGDFERISDHALNISETAQEMHDKKIRFSEKAKAEIRVYTKAMIDIMELTTKVFYNGDIQLATAVEPLEEVIDGLNVELKKRHVKRLRNGECTIELGFILSDIISNYERVADHCSNIAVCLIQIHDDGFDTHEYLEQIRSEENREFMEMYRKYKKNYELG